jgi:hypothetical protein
MCSFTATNGANMGYFDHFIKNSVSHIALEHKLFPNAKEVTETLACFYAVSQNILRERNDFARRDVHIIVVGDGGTPRTASWFALNSAWNCYSVDPEMSNKRWENKIERLKCYRKRVEDISIDCMGEEAVLIHPHSHARLSDSVASLRNYKNLSVVAMPCCVPQNLAEMADMVYEDHQCLSPHRTIKVWNNVRGDKV